MGSKEKRKKVREMEGQSVEKREVRNVKREIGKMREREGNSVKKREVRKEK